MSYYDHAYGSNVSDSDDDMSFISNRQKVNKVLSEQETDKLSFTVQRWGATSGKSKKISTILFASGTQNSTIRNAVTGVKYYGHAVGSRNEDLYFKVMHCTGEFVGNKGPVALFYDSAEQYERHMSTAYGRQSLVDQHTKEKFEARHRIARLR